MPSFVPRWLSNGSLARRRATDDQGGETDHVLPDEAPSSACSQN